MEFSGRNEASSSSSEPLDEVFSSWSPAAVPKDGPVNADPVWGGSKQLKAYRIHKLFHGFMMFSELFPGFWKLL